MKALLVVDVQANVMKRRNTEGLIEACNDIISQYEPEQVIYVVHKLPWERASKKKEFGAGLSVVSNYVFDKREGDAFSNPKLLQRLQELNADEVEIIGLDGNFCIKETALGALKNGLKATVNVRAVVSKNEKAFEDTKHDLRDAGVKVIYYPVDVAVFRDTYEQVVGAVCSFYLIGYRTSMSLIINPKVKMYCLQVGRRT